MAAVRFLKTDNEIDLNPNQDRYVRTADVTDVDFTEGNEVEILWDALAEVGIVRGAILPGHDTYILTRIRGSVISYRQIRVWLVYEVLRFGTWGASPVMTVFTDGTFLSSYTTNRVPGTRAPIEVPTWTKSGQTPREKDYVTFTFLRPTRQINISAIKAGSIEDVDLVGQTQSYVGYVNDDAWRGYPKGYWMMSRFQTSVSKFTGYYSVEAETICRVIDDWSEFGTLRNELTGKYLDPSLSDVPGALAAALALPYSHGIIYGVTGSGLVRVGPYPTTNFESIFGP